MSTLRLFSQDITEEDKERDANPSLYGDQSVKNETYGQPRLGRPTSALTSYLRRESISIPSTTMPGPHQPSQSTLGVDLSQRFAERGGREALEFNDNSSSNSDDDLGSFAAPGFSNGKKVKLLSSDLDLSERRSGKVSHGLVVGEKSGVVRASSPILDAAASVAAAFEEKEARERASRGSGAEGEAGGHERLLREHSSPPIERGSDEVFCWKPRYYSSCSFVGISIIPEHHAALHPKY